MPGPVPGGLRAEGARGKGEWPHKGGGVVSHRRGVVSQRRGSGFTKEGEWSHRRGSGLKGGEWSHS